MRIVISYHARDMYDIPDEKWHEVMALCGNDEGGVVDFLMEEGILDGYVVSSDVTDRYVEIEGE